MALAVAQVAHTYPTSGSSTTAATFTNPTTVGRHAVAIVGGYQGASGPSSVTDNKGNTWTRDFDTATSPIWIAVYSAPIATGGATHTVTFSQAGVDIANLDIIEVEDMVTAAFDKSSQNAATSATWTTGSTGTLAQADEIAFVYVAVDSGDVGDTITQDPTFTLIGEQESGLAYISNAAYKIVAATTAIDHAWTQTFGSVPWTAVIVTYKGPPSSVIGVVAASEAADVSAIAGTSTDPPGNSGVIAVTEAADVAALAGTSTDPSNVTGTIVAVETGDISAITGTVPFSHRYASAISGRKIVDQFGDVYLMRAFSSWSMAENLSNAEITEALEGLAAQGFNAATIGYGGGIDFGGWHRYTNDAGQAFWNGTPWASTFGPGWSSVDWCVSECDRLGMTINLSLFYSWGDNGNANNFNAVTTTQAYNAGFELAIRYLAYTNIVWHVMFDLNPGLNANIDALFHGINDAETAGRRPVRWCEANQDSSTYGAIITQGYSHFNVTCNGFYEYEGNSTDRIETSYNEVGATTLPTGDVEPPYDGSPHYNPGNLGLNLRYRSWAVFLEGGSYENYGHEDWWCFGFSNPFGFGEGLTWQQVLTHVHTTQQSYCWAFLDEFVADPTWAPTSAFVTTGQGTGSDRAAIGASGTVAAAYFPNNRAVTVDTTIIAGTGDVRLRWFDPFLGTYTTISASEAQTAGRTVVYPGNHVDGTADFVLVVDPAPPTGVIATTETADVATIVGTSTAPPSGVIAAVEEPDVAAIIAVFTPPVAVIGVIAAVEGGPDVAVITGTFGDGLIAVVEEPDVAVITGSFVGAPITGVIVAVETNDIARLRGGVPGAIDPGPSMILGEWAMRRGDRLPMLAVAIEDDTGLPVDLTDGTAFLQLRAEDGGPTLELPDGFPPVTYVDGWLRLPAYIYDAFNGIVVYDWPDAQTAGLAVGVDDLIVTVTFPDGGSITAPSSREARLIVRPAVLPPF